MVISLPSINCYYVQRIGDLPKYNFTGLPLVDLGSFVNTNAAVKND